MRRLCVLLALVASVACATHQTRPRFAAQASTACSVTLFWDANTEPDLAGYVVASGTTSRSYTRTQHVSVMPAPTTTVLGLACGTTHYFAARAYNTATLYSGYSNEVTVVLPPAPPDGRKPAPMNVRIGP